LNREGAKSAKRKKRRRKHTILFTHLFFVSFVPSRFNPDRRPW